MAMFEPPPGYDDLLSDAAEAPIRGELAELEVADVGVIVCRRPYLRDAAALAMSVNRKATPDMQASYVQQFVTDHLEHDAFVDLLYRMIDGDLPADTVGLIARAIATCGTSRPYLAVVNLASITGQVWRMVRTRIAEHGVEDPMTGLSSLHALLDHTEQLVLQSYEGLKPAAQRAKRAQFFNALYAPERTAKPINGPDYKQVPAGFDKESVDASFEAFAAAAR
jgi:hypothetical protein